MVPSLQPKKITCPACGKTTATQGANGTLLPPGRRRDGPPAEPDTFCFPVAIDDKNAHLYCDKTCALLSALVGLRVTIAEAAGKCLAPAIGDLTKQLAELNQTAIGSRITMGANAIASAIARTEGDASDAAEKLVEAAEDQEIRKLQNDLHKKATGK